MGTIDRGHLPATDLAAGTSAQLKDGRDDPEEPPGAAEPDIVAAGAVVLRPGPDGTEVLLVHRPRLDDWSVPKGKLDPDEHPLAAAVREVAEETGVTAALGRRLPPARYVVGGTKHKLVHYWTATVAGIGTHEPDEEVDEVRWLPLPQAARLVTHRWDQRTLSGLASHADPGEGIVGVPPVVLVRHAKAMPRKGWDGDDALRPLSAEGERQALTLVPLLATVAPDEVHSSPSTRCMQTITPFSQVTERPVRTDPEVSEEGFAADPEVAHQLLAGLLAAREPGGPVRLLCTHRPILDAVLHRLTGTTRGPRRLSPGEFMVLTGDSHRPRLDRYPLPG